MTELDWQKSTYSETASSCVYVTTTRNGTILLRESDEPEAILSTGPRQLKSLITSLRSKPYRSVRPA